MPSLKEIRLRDIRPAAMQALKEHASQYFSGEIRICEDNRTCFEGADIISTCTNGDEQLVRPEWFKPGAFAVGIEGGCAYTAEALHSAAKFIVDDIPLARYFDRISKDRLTEDGQPDPEFPGGLPEIYATIGEVVTRRKPARTSATERILAIPIGMAICDVALGQLTFTKAVERGVRSEFSPGLIVSWHLNPCSVKAWKRRQERIAKGPKGAPHYSSLTPFPGPRLDSRETIMRLGRRCFHELVKVIFAQALNLR